MVRAKVVFSESLNNCIRLRFGYRPKNSRLEESERSEADLHHPMLKDAKPMAPKRTLQNYQKVHLLIAGRWSKGVRKSFRTRSFNKNKQGGYRR